MESHNTPKTLVPSTSQGKDSPLTPLGWAILRGQDPARLFAGDEPAPPPSERALPAARPVWLLSVWLIGPFLVLDLLYGPVTFLTDYLGWQWQNWNLPFLAVCLGLLGAQASALLLDLAFSPQPWWRRTLVFAPLAVLYLGACLLGTALTFWCNEPYFYDIYYGDGIRFFFGLPLVALAGLAPLVTFRWVFGWALVSRDAAGNLGSHIHRPASLLNMLLLIGAIVGGFGLIRLAPLDSTDGPELMWVVTGALSLAAGGTSLFGVIPVVVIWHYVKHDWLRAPSVIGVLVLGIVAAFALDAVFFTSWAEVVDNAVLNAAMFAGIGGSYVVGLALYLELLRWWGWAVKPALRYQVN